jgi:hypothetical protein
MAQRRTRQLIGLLLVLALLMAGLSGCGNRPASVSGKVTYAGQTLSSGLVVFVASDGKVSQPAGIEVDGSYTADNVPVGPVTACVETFPLSGDGVGPNAPKDQPRPRYTPIPAKYKDAKQSELTLDVKPGANVYDINLR